jgi:MFS family permease
MRPSKARYAVTALFVVHGVLVGTWIARIPSIKDDLGLGEGELGLALLFATLGALVGMPLTGWLVAHQGSRGVSGPALVVFALILPALALAPNLLLLSLALALFGFAMGALDVAMNAHGLTVEGRYGRPILSSLHAGWSFGGLVGAGTAALVAGVGVGPLPHFVLVAVAVGVVGLAAVAALLPASADRPDVAPTLGRPPRRLAALAVLAFCGLFAEGTAADWSGVYLAESLHTSTAFAALGFAAFSVAMVVFRLLGDGLVARWGPVAVVRRGAALGGVGFAVALAVGHPALALVGLACVGAGVAAMVPVFFRAAGSLPGVPASVGIAALTTVGYSAFLVAPPVVGFSAELVGLPLALGLVPALLGILVVLAPRTEPVARAAVQPA